MKKLISVLLLLGSVSCSLYGQNDESPKKHRDRISKINYFKFEPTQFFNLEFGAQYEHYFDGGLSIGCSAGFNRGSFIDLTQSGKKFMDESFVSTYDASEWGYHFGASLRMYFKRRVGPYGFYGEVELRTKKWYKKEIDVEHGHYIVDLDLMDAQIIPKIGWVPNRSHWVELYLGLAINQSFGTARGPKYVGLPNGDNGGAYIEINQKVTRTVYRPRFGVVICF